MAADFILARRSRVAAGLTGVVGICIVAVVAVGTAVAQPPSDSQRDAIEPAIAGLERLGRTLGLDGWAFGREVEDVVPGRGQSLLSALCRIAEGGGEACFGDVGGTEDLVKRVLAGQTALAAAASAASALHEEAYEALVKGLFDRTFCRPGSTLPCEDWKRVQEVQEWWREHGSRAIMVLGLAGQTALAAAASAASALHEKAYEALVKGLFDRTFCRPGSTLSCEDLERVQEVQEWWREHGSRAIMVLDRIAVRGRSCAASGRGRIRPKNVSYSGRNRRIRPIRAVSAPPLASSGAPRSFATG